MQVVMQLTDINTLREQMGAIVYYFIWCVECAFDIRLPQKNTNYSPDDADVKIMPKEPFLGQIRQLFATNPDFKAEWTCIMSTMWKSSQYIDNEPEVEPKNSDEFPDLIPHHICLYVLNKALATFESKKTELQARRVDLLRNLAHLHAATAGRGSPSHPAPQHADPDGAGTSNKRKLSEMSTLLERWVIG
jgi:hypothetical protein